jgi:hypothetical protein
MTEKNTSKKFNVEKMFLHHYNLVVVDNYLDIQLKIVLHDHVILVHELFVLLFHENNFLLEDEDVVHEVLPLNVVLQLHDV